MAPDLTHVHVPDHTLLKFTERIDEVHEGLDIGVALWIGQLNFDYHADFCVGQERKIVFFKHSRCGALCRCHLIPQIGAFGSAVTGHRVVGARAQRVLKSPKPIARCEDEATRRVVGVATGQARKQDLNCWHGLSRSKDAVGNLGLHARQSWLRYAAVRRLITCIRLVHIPLPCVACPDNPVAGAPPSPGRSKRR